MFFQLRGCQFCANMVRTFTAAKHHFLWRFVEAVASFVVMRFENIMPEYAVVCEGYVRGLLRAVQGPHLGTLDDAW
jgi:hypothetical protein